MQLQIPKKQPLQIRKQHLWKEENQQPLIRSQVWMIKKDSSTVDATVITSADREKATTPLTDTTTSIEKEIKESTAEHNQETENSKERSVTRIKEKMTVGEMETSENQKDSSATAVTEGMPTELLPTIADSSKKETMTPSSPNSRDTTNTIESAITSRTIREIDQSQEPTNKPEQLVTLDNSDLIPDVLLRGTPLPEVDFGSVRPEQSSTVTETIIETDPTRDTANPDGDDKNYKPESSTTVRASTMTQTEPTSNTDRLDGSYTNDKPGSSTTVTETTVTQTDPTNDARRLGSDSNTPEGTTSIHRV
ncbi:mucin-5AC-like isoform X1 [Hemicordylus capensis]|uniref:mucin-5AC-like isoform X1 n=1 Tax=Hemicordylus capensis TaxID=884348 RepID=UPI00230400FC|nr:mucin-5AC-like isoform X1 [Hemicordylus capensis]